MSKQSGDVDNQVTGIASEALSFAQKNPGLAEKALDVASKFASQQGESNSQVQNSEPKKPLKKGPSMKTKLMIGVGALLLMLALGPLIFPAIAGMGAVGTAVMAGAGAGLLAYGASKVAEERKTPSTGNPNRVQPSSNQMTDQMANAIGMAQQQQPSKSNNLGQGRDSSLNQANDSESITRALEEARESGVIDGVKPNEKIIKEVDAKRAELMTELALPDTLKTMVKSKTTNMPAFEAGFDKHLKQSFFANMGEKQSGRGDGGMGEGFLSKVNQEQESDEKKAFDQFKGNMMALLKKDQEHYQSPQAHDALIAEKSALTTAIEQIQGLRAGNKVSKDRLDKSGMIMVEKDQKDKADKVRLDSLKTANENIRQAKDSFETKKTEAKSTTGTSQSSQAPAPDKTQAPASARR